MFIEMVSVGNPGDQGELSGEGAGGVGPDRICGAVDWVCNIGKYEVTAGQYTQFLNAVAATDTYGLYNSSMLSGPYGCSIERSGSSGSYTYSVVGDWADRPVNYVSWGDAARFANRLHNGQPTGPRDATTTEDASYDLSATQSYYGPDGETPPVSTDDWYALNDALLGITPEPDATSVIPSEDEWYKAAYHKNDGVTGNYYDYPTSSDSVPSTGLVDPDPGNNATFNYSDGSGYTIGSPYYRTEVGEHENSDSPYGTFDQGGKALEWNEGRLWGTRRCLRGGSFSGICSTVSCLPASHRYAYHAPSTKDYAFGFRGSEVP